MSTNDNFLEVFKETFFSVLKNSGIVLSESEHVYLNKLTEDLSRSLEKMGGVASERLLKRIKLFENFATSVEQGDLSAVNLDVARIHEINGAITANIKAFEIFDKMQREGVEGKKSMLN